MIDEQLQAAARAAPAQIPAGVVALWALAGVVAAAFLMRGWRGRYVDLKVGASLLVLCGLVVALLLLSVARQEAGCHVERHDDEESVDVSGVGLGTRESGP